MQIMLRWLSSYYYVMMLYDLYLINSLLQYKKS
jgi:hypothetical protein